MWPDQEGSNVIFTSWQKTDPEDIILNRFSFFFFFLMCVLLLSPGSFLAQKCQSVTARCRGLI